MMPLRFLDSGESMLVVEFGDRIDPAVNELVLALDGALTAAGLPGVVETVPTFRSLAVHYEPLEISRAALIARLAELAAGAKVSARAAKRWRLPVSFAPPDAEDLEEVAARIGVTPTLLVDTIVGTPLRVHMYGFAPGFAYLGGLPEALRVARRPVPRAPHPANAVMIGGGMAAVASFPMPTGWWVLGRSAERLFAPLRHPEFLVAVGDEIRFEAVSAGEFAMLEARVAAGEVVARVEAIR